MGSNSSSGNKTKTKNNNYNNNHNNSTSSIEWSHWGTGPTIVKNNKQHENSYGIDDSHAGRIMGASPKGGGGRQQQRRRRRPDRPDRVFGEGNIVPPTTLSPR